MVTHSSQSLSRVLFATLITVLLPYTAYSSPLPISISASLPKIGYPYDDSDEDTTLVRTDNENEGISQDVIVFIGILIGFSLMFLITIIIYIVQLIFRRGGIRLTNDIPGSLDDAEREAEEDRRALDELSPNEQELYFLAKDFLTLNPMNNLELPLAQSLIIQEKGVNAWEFKPNIENEELIHVSNKTEIEFLNDDQELSIQTNFPIPKQNEVYYFETKIYELPSPQDTIVTIGLATSPYPFFRLPGRNRYSIGYDSNGNRRYNQAFELTASTGLHIFPELQHGDVIGCGIRTNSRTIFFTRNGKKLSESKIGGHVKLPKNLQVYPTIGATNRSTLHVNIGQIGYVFIEGNVKKWGFGPLEGTEIPPPLYNKFNKDVLLESSDLDPNDLNLRNGDFPPNFWDIIATPAEFTDIDDDDIDIDRDITLQSLQEEGLRSGDFILPPVNPPSYIVPATSVDGDDDDTQLETELETAPTSFLHDSDGEEEELYAEAEDDDNDSVLGNDTEAEGQ